MTHLYEVTDEYVALTQRLNDEEFTEESLKERLAEIKEQFNIKAENIGKVVISMESISESIEHEIARLTARQKSINNRASYLRDYLFTEMMASGNDRIQGTVLTLSLRKSPPSCQVLDEKAIPEQFIRIIPEQRQVDKRGILDHFKATGEVPNGTEIITDRKTLSIK